MIDSIDRRSLLKGFAITTLGATVPPLLKKLLISSAQAAETERPLDLSALSRLFKDPQYLENLRNGCTARDVKILLKYMIRAASEPEVRDFAPPLEEGLHRGSMTLRYADSFGNATRLRMREKNGSYVLIEVSAGHVVTDSEKKLYDEAAKSGWRTLYPNGPDKAVRLVTDAKDSIGLPFSFSQTQLDIGGEIGTILGTDIDRAAVGMTPERKKFYNGVISPKFTDQMLSLLGYKEEDFRFLRNQRAMVIPVPEATETMFGDLPAQGMSGTAVLTRPMSATGVHFAGALSAVSLFKIGKQSFALAFFFDQQEFGQTIRELIPEIEDTHEERTPTHTIASRK